MEKATRVRLLNPEPKYRFQPNGQRRKCFEVIRRGVNREGIITIRAYVLGCARQGIRSASAHSDLSSLIKHKLVERVNEAYERRLKSEGSLRLVGTSVDLVADQVYPVGEKRKATSAAIGERKPPSLVVRLILSPAAAQS
jgi:hypothetical protein